MGLWAALKSELQQSLSRQSIVGCVDLENNITGHSFNWSVYFYFYFIYFFLTIIKNSSKFSTVELFIFTYNAATISIVYFGVMCCLACVYTIILHICDILYALSLLAVLFRYCDLYKLFNHLVPLPLSSIPTNKKRVLVSYIFFICIMSLQIHLFLWY